MPERQAAVLTDRAAGLVQTLPGSGREYREAALRHSDTTIQRVASTMCPHTER